MTASPTKLALLKKAENDLLDDCHVYSSGDISDVNAKKRHLALAEEYARARWATVTGSGGTKPRPATSNLELRISRSKGKTIAKAETNDLKWSVTFLDENILDVSKERWRSDNVKLRDAINAELAFRGEA
ncbi:MAG: hypothetical protein JNM17_06685 [Archangium sp.]|nr:hypothetical protein [Archangium sp.]